METLPIKIIDDLSGGVVSYADLDTLPENVSPHTINMHFDLLGDVTQRNGTTKLGATVSAGNSCNGISQFKSFDGTKNKLVAAFNGTNYAYDGVTWTSIGGGMVAGTSVRYTSFLNNMYRVGGGAATSSWDGGGGAFGGVGGAPTGKYIIPYKQRLYIAGDATYPTRLWFSTIASFSGATTWDTSGTSTQYIDFTPTRANDFITGIDKISNQLIIFLNNGMYRFNGSSTDAELIVKVGCSSQESIAEGKGFLFFFNPTGIYITTGGYPQEISRPVFDWIQGMSPSNYSSVAGFCDGDHYYCFIGNVTLPTAKYKRQVSYTNVMLVYTISSQVWTIYSLGNAFNAFTTYSDTSSNLTYVGGDTVGNVQTMWSGNTDNTTPISYEYDSRPHSWGSQFTTKSLIEMGLNIINGTGMQVGVSEELKPFKTIGQITNLYTILTSINAKGKQLQIKIFGVNSSTPVIFDGYEFIRVENLGYVRQ